MVDGGKQVAGRKRKREWGALVAINRQLVA
jgi:hypothetical protein